MQGVASLALHAYGDQDWLLAKIQMLQTIFSGPDNDMRSIYVLFVRPISTTRLKTCKTKLRSHFALVDSKSSVHIPDYHGEAVLIAEMVLNPNSMMFLNRHEGGSCQEEASNLARRLNLSPVNPESFVLKGNNKEQMNFFRFLILLFWVNLTQCFTPHLDIITYSNNIEYEYKCSYLIISSQSFI